MIYYIGNTPLSDSLWHHGIQGMHWGERHGPPYPLDYQSHSRVEKQQNPKRLISAGGESRSTKTRSTVTSAEKVRKAEKTDQSTQAKHKQKSSDDFNRDLLGNNPNAAVVNPSLKDWAKAHKKEIAIGVGVAAAVGVGVILAKHGKTPVKNLNNVARDAAKIPGAEVKVAQISNEFGGFKSNEHRFLAQWFKADMHRYDSITPEEFTNMSDEGVSLTAGEKLFRMSKGNHATLRDGIEYVSFGEDRQRYMGFLPQMWRANGAMNSKFFEAELDALTHIKAPGKKESVEILQAALKQEYPSWSDDYIRKMSFREFYRVQAQLIDRNYDLGKAYLAEAKARGYNAVIDWNDAGRLADKPLILMNGAKQASVKAVQQYSIKQTREAFRQIKLPSNVSEFKIDDWNAEALRGIYEPLFTRFLA